jgi:ComF family protein
MADWDICQACLHDLARNRSSCYRCGLHFDQAPSSPQLCGRCLQQTPPFDDTFAPFLYQGGMRYLISQLKFQHQLANARLLGNLLADHLTANAERPDCLVPVPLHPRRYRQRGFNQSIEIARTVSKRLALPLDLNSCQRLRDTGHQSALPAKQRRANLRNAFAVTRAMPYQHLAIIDDVMTTGATVTALATALKNSGVNRVDVWVCARA